MTWAGVSINDVVVALKPRCSQHHSSTELLLKAEEHDQTASHVDEECENLFRLIRRKLLLCHKVLRVLRRSGHVLRA